MKHGPPTFARLIAWSVLLLGLSVGCGGGCGSDPVPPPATREMPDADRSSVEASKSQAIRANGKDLVDIKVTVRKADGTALEGRTVKVTVSGEGTTVLQPAGTTDALGVAIAKVSATVAGIKTVTASVEAEGGPVTLTSRPSLEFIVLPASKLVFTQAPTSGTAGAALGAFEVTIQNGDGEKVTGATSTVTVKLGSGPTAAALEGAVSAAAVNGVARFSELVLKKAAQGYTLVASGEGLTGTTSQTFDVVPAAPATLAVAQVAATVTAGDALSPEVSVLDAFGNVVTGYTGTVRFSSDGSATLPTDYTFTAADAGRHVFTGALVLKQAGTRQVTVKDTADATLGSTREVGVVAGAAAKLAFIEQPTDRFVRQTFGVQVALTDAFGNRVAASAPAVSLGLNKATGTLVGLAPVMPLDGVASFPGLSIAEDDAGYVLTASALGLTPTPSNAFTITDNVAPAEPELTLTVNGIDSLTVGWKAVGDDGLFGQASSYEFLYSVDPDFTGALPVSLGNPKPANALESVTLPGLIPGTTYYVGLKVTDNAGNAVRVTRSATTPYPTASKLVFLEQPRNGTAGSPQLSPPVTVAIQDTDGRLVGNANFAVTLTVKGVSGFGPFTVAANKGVATFDGANAVRIDKAGKDYSLEATASTASGTPLTPATSDFFNITHAPASRLVLSGPDSVIATTKHSVTVTVRDPFDNLAEGYVGRVTLTSEDTAASLPEPHDFIAAIDKGQFTFTDVILNTAGPQTLTASSSTLTSNTLRVEVAPVPPGKLVLTGLPATMKAGESHTVTVEVLDGFDKRDTGYTGTVRFTSTDGKATLPGEYTFDKDGDKGIKTFPVTLVTARALAHSVTVKDKDKGGLPTFTATASTTVTWAELARFVMDAPGSAKAGDPFTAQVTAVDAYDNTVEDYTGTVGFSSDPTGATVPMDYTFTGNGSSVFTFTVKKAGSTTLTVTDAALGKSGSDTVDVSHGSARHFVMAVTPSGPVTAGTELTVGLTVKDDFGNVATGYTGTVGFASSDTKAILPGPDATTFATGDDGHKSFSVTLKTAKDVAQTLSVKDTDPASAFLSAETSIQVNPGPAAKLAFRAQPQGARVRESLGTVTVAVTDLFDNVVDVSSPELSLRLIGGNASAVFSGMVPANPSGGIATFSGMSVDQQGSGFQLEAQGGAYDAVSSDPFTIVDDVAPSAPSLVEVSKTSVRVELQWEVVGDDGMVGTATSYELRHAESPIDDTTFADASDEGVAVILPESGTQVSGVITGLRPDATHYFALRAKDDAGNASMLSLLIVQTKEDPCVDVTCTAKAPTCDPNGVSRIVYTSTCVDVDAKPFCDEGRTITKCPDPDGVCFMGACDTAARPGANALSVSEVMHTSSSSKTTEYVELKNNTGNLLNLNGLAVAFRTSAGTTAGSFTVGSGGVPVILNRKGTFVLAQNKDEAANGGVAADFAYGSGIDLDTSGQIQLVSGSTVVEDFRYTTSFPQTTGRAMNLSSLVVGTRANSRPWYWCDSELTALLSGGDYGTPNKDNSTCGIAPNGPVDYCVIQYPKSFPSADDKYPATVLVGSSWNVFSQFYESSITNRNTKGNDNYPHVFAELGYGADPANPAGWTWTSANPNAGYSSTASNDDEMMGSLSISTSGVQYYGFRYRFLDPSTGTYSDYTYCDQEGIAVPSVNKYGRVAVSALAANHLVISEFSGTGSGGSTDEFIELYNPTNTAVNLSGWTVQYMKASGGTGYSGSVTIESSNVRNGTTFIKPKGYFLLAGANYAGTGFAKADVVYTFDTSGSGAATGGGHVRIGPGLNASNVDDTKTVDKLGFGAADRAEGKAAAPAHPAVGGSLERKAYSASTSTSMADMTATGDGTHGNGIDSDINASDFVTRSSRDPQNSQASTEVQ